MKNSWVSWTLTAGALRLLAAMFLPLLPEEAYHWCYADRLDFGYYDHPPMIAWMIAGGRLLFGDTALGVRLLPLLASIGTTAAVGWVSHRLHGAAAARWTVLLLSIEPALLMGSSFGFPDSPLLLFWSLSLVFLVMALESGRGEWWLAVGAAAGAALLSKYTAAFLPASVLLYLLVSRRDRGWLLRPWPYLGALVALAVFSPVIVWNSTHDWASFRFQGSERLQGMRAPHLRSALIFLGGQWGSILPFVLPVAVAAVWSAIRRRTREDLLLLCVSLPMIGFFFVVGCTRSTHVFWTLPSYLALTVLMGGAVAEGQGRIARLYRPLWRWILGVTAAGFLAGAVHAVHPFPWLPALEGVYGWDVLSARARELRTSLGEESFIIGVGKRYGCPSQLAFHLHSVRGVHAKNLLGHDGLQFAYWADRSALVGKNAVVVAESAWSTDLDRTLRSVFTSVEEEERWTIHAGKRIERYVIYIARSFHPERLDGAGDGIH